MPWHETGSDEANHKPDESEKGIPPDATRTTLRHQRNDPPAKHANCRATHAIQDQEDDGEDGGKKEHVDILTLCGLLDLETETPPETGPARRVSLNGAKWPVHHSVLDWPQLELRPDGRLTGHNLIWLT
jgi:hypothetical protein